MPRCCSCRASGCWFATHSAVSPRSAGRLHHPDDAQGEPREVDVGDRAAAFVGHRAAGSPRTRASAWTRPTLAFVISAPWAGRSESTDRSSGAHVSSERHRRRVGRSLLAHCATGVHSPPPPYGCASCVCRACRPANDGALLRVVHCTYVLQHITPSMCCVWLCAVNRSAAAFPLLRWKSRVELQHIIGPPRQATPVGLDS